ncbi:glycosyltransferase family 4 protein [Pedobacter sandarakinus]|uniref:glycosyltransferase family 4 protein n=1 Tax=Pedobacter sandarakinus TaxID=353156 RepID=UPI00224536B1|nr:glycosyltransferase family 1 protein [Pedobacter sandarakinus]MCX2574021.1 glycosyltransferase family 1 protein [Pedobacter sandarakinus]
MKIKIFVDAHVFDGVHQGTTTYIKGIYTALVANEAFEITLAANNIDHLRSQFNDDRFKYIKLPTSSKFKRLIYDIPRIITDNRYDYAHFQYIVPLIKSCKYINTIHDLLFLDFPKLFPFSYRFTKKYLFNFSAKRSDIICTVSDYSKNALIKYFKIHEGKIVITPNAVQLARVPPIDIRSKYNINNYILFVSRFEPRKNHYAIIKAFVELELYKIKELVFIGRRQDVNTQKFNDFYDTLVEDVKSKIIFLEGISNDELNNFYRQADLFIFPAFAEGFGIPPLEAAVNSCKVLCSNTTAMKDFDFFGKYQFNPEDIEELKSKMLKVLNDGSYPFGAVKEAILKKYNWNIIAERFGEEIIQDFSR